MLLVVGTVAGCGGDDPSTGTAGATSGAGTADGGTSPDDKQPPPPPAWADSLNSAIGHLDHARFDEANKQLQAAEAVLSAAADGDEKTAGSKQLAALKSQLSSAREAEVTRLAEEKARKRAERLVEAKELQESGKLDEATAALDGVLSMAPTSEQRAEVRELKAVIDAHRSARRRGTARPRRGNGRLIIVSFNAFIRSLAGRRPRRRPYPRPYWAG